MEWEKILEHETKEYKNVEDFEKKMVPTLKETNLALFLKQPKEMHKLLKEMLENDLDGLSKYDLQKYAFMILVFLNKYRYNDTDSNSRSIYAVHKYVRAFLIARNALKVLNTGDEMALLNIHDNKLEDFDDTKAIKNIIDSHILTASIDARVSKEYIDGVSNGLSFYFNAN